MKKPWFIAISGVMGAGKTTLSRGLAQILNWSYAPENITATLYLKDFFTNRKRWAFETQTAFLVHKALQVQGILQQNHNLILDRSLFEDLEIFAKYFYDQGDIDERSYKTYNAIAAHFLDAIPTPDIIIYCDCPIEIIKDRIPKRDKAYQDLYPPNHVDKIYDLYEKWRNNYQQSALYRLDTFSVDSRRQDILEIIAKDVIDILEKQRNTSQVYQYNLFDVSSENLRRDAHFLTQIFTPNEFTDQPRGPLAIPPRQVKITKYPSAYIAAPFTDRTVPIESEQNLLLENELEHGLLRKGSYRKELLDITKALEQMGIYSILPHRDVNEWGKRKLSPNKVIELCTEYVETTDIFIGILGMSHGSHYEFGIARGLRKPAIIINCEEIQQSFIASGIFEIQNTVLLLRCEKMSQIPTLLLDDRTRGFMRQHIPIR